VMHGKWPSAECDLLKISERSDQLNLFKKT
jgi:hypothetical protein